MALTKQQIYTEIKWFRKFVKKLKPKFGDDKFVQLVNLTKKINLLEDQVKELESSNKKKKQELSREINSIINFVYGLFK